MHIKYAVLCTVYIVHNPAAAPKILLPHSNCVHLYVHTENALKMRMHFNFAGNVVIFMCTLASPHPAAALR